MAAFLVGWALLGLAASSLPFTPGFSSRGREPVEIPPDDPRYGLHAKSLDLAAHLARAATPPAEPLDPNRAPPEELDRLPGVGPRTALRWVAVRDSSGPFLALSDLARVRGLGPKRSSRLARYLAFPRAAQHGGGLPGCGTLDVNRARLRELESLPGVGPALAARILQYRALHGRLRSPADLDSVPGVGPALLRRLKGRLRFE